MVVAEDLRNYGFDVTWNQADRALTIDRDDVEILIESKYVAPEISSEIDLTVGSV